MEITTKIEIPDEFLAGITPGMLDDFLVKNGLEELRTWTNGIGILHESARLLNKPLLSILREFGWERCRTCEEKRYDAHDEVKWCGFAEGDYQQIQGDYGCCHYKFKEVA